MSTMKINYVAPSMMRPVFFNVILPNDLPPFMTAGNPHFDRPMKTLWLLHGYNGGCDDWLTGSLISNLAVAYNIAVVLPDGQNSFYLNGKATGFQFEDLLSRDLPQYLNKTLGLSLKPEDNFIGGLSMGGFGAIHTGLAHPELFGKMFGLSSALIQNQLKDFKPDAENPMANYDYYVQMFGDLNTAAERDVNPEVIAAKRLAKGEKIQPIYMACGSEDFLINENRAFHEFLVSKGIDVCYNEAPGVHNWDFWNAFIEPAIKWALEA